MESWQGLPPEISTQYAVVRLIKRTEDKEIILLQNKADNSRVVLRNYPHNLAQVYTVLLGKQLSCIPQVLAASERPGGSYVLEEFIEGSPLVPGKLSQHQILHTLHQLCRALTDLHALGIIHRDIKPDNLIFTETEKVYLIDFDAARLYKSYVEHDTCLLGTSGFAAPEQFGITQTDHRADIFSLGVTLNILITGFHPSEKLCSGWMRHIVLKCTNIDPKARYQTAKQIWRSAKLFIALPHQLIHNRLLLITLLLFVLCFICVIILHIILFPHFPASGATHEANSAYTASISSSTHVQNDIHESSSAASLNSAPESSSLPTSSPSPSAPSTVAPVATPKSSSVVSDSTPTASETPSPKPIAPVKTSAPAPTAAPQPTATPKPTPVPDSLKPGYSEVLTAAEAYDEAQQRRSTLQQQFMNADSLPHNVKLHEINVRMGRIELDYTTAQNNTRSSLETLQSLQAADPPDEVAVAAAQETYDAAVSKEAEAKAAYDGIHAEYQSYVNSPEFQVPYAEEQAMCQSYYEADLEATNAANNLRQLQNKYGIYLRNI